MTKREAIIPIALIEKKDPTPPKFFSIANKGRKDMIEL